MSFYRCCGKRGLDLVLAIAGLCLLWPVFIVIAILIKASSPGPVFFGQVRTGAAMRPFNILKFRTMEQTAPGSDPITVADDVRVTRFGRFLRRYKLDELPQLWNVVRGDMSIVGPRPELEHFVLQRYSEEQRREIFSVRPGLTDPCAISSIDQDEIPAHEASPVDYYQRIVLPAKIAAHLDYVRTMSFQHDIRLIVQTAVAIARKPFVSRTDKVC